MELSWRSYSPSLNRRWYIVHNATPTLSSVSSDRAGVSSSRGRGSIKPTTRSREVQQTQSPQRRRKTRRRLKPLPPHPQRARRPPATVSRHRQKKSRQTRSSRSLSKAVGLKPANHGVASQRPGRYRTNSRNGGQTGMSVLPVMMMVLRL